MNKVEFCGLLYTFILRVKSMNTTSFWHTLGCTKTDNLPPLNFVLDDGHTRTKASMTANEICLSLTIDHVIVVDLLFAAQVSCLMVAAII